MHVMIRKLEHSVAKLKALRIHRDPRVTCHLEDWLDENKGQEIEAIMHLTAKEATQPANLEKGRPFGFFVHFGEILRGMSFEKMVDKAIRTLSLIHVRRSEELRVARGGSYMSGALDAFTEH